MNVDDSGHQDRQKTNQKVEDYLSRLRAGLRGLSADEIREIVEELRSHILDKVAEGGGAANTNVEAALSALGDPEKLASEYVTDALLSRAAVSRSPWRVLDSLFRWASLSVAGFFVLLISIVGYFLGAVLILCAALKPFHPRTAGLWVIPENTGEFEISLRLGFGNVPTIGHEIMGWWIVPVGLILGCALLMLTTRFALLCARQYRRSHALPHES